MLDKLYKNYRLRKINIALIIIILVLSIFSLQAYGEENVVNEVKDILNNYYIDDIPKNILDSDSANKIIKDLNDPYTQIMNIDYYNSIVNNIYYGVGVNIQMTELGAKVVSIIVNSPAMEVGISEGDIITAVNGNPLKDLSAGFALKTINGKQGEPNELKIQKGDKEFLIEVIPGKVYYPTVIGNLINNNIGYIQITSFGPNTADEFEYAIKNFTRQQVDSYIVDLRNNPGGFILSAVELSSYFTKDEIIALGQTKQGYKIALKRTEKIKYINKPAFFLVNRNTASAAEVMAACAQDYGTAVIIGETTYGKGVAQNTFQLSDGSILKATTLKMYSPKGRELSSYGITPDIKSVGLDLALFAELLTAGGGKTEEGNRGVRVIIDSKPYYISLSKLVNNNYFEAYKQLVNQSTSIDLSNYFYLSQARINAIKNYPILKCVEIPKTEYKIGERATFKISAPNYNGKVQYRAMVWDEVTNKYIDLWNTKDRYYDKWKPNSKDIFTISFPITKPGNYRIRIFVKRSGIPNSKTVLKGMNCDSYVYELPFTYK